MRTEPSRRSLTGMDTWVAGPASTAAPSGAVRSHFRVNAPPSRRPASMEREENSRMPAALVTTRHHSSRDWVSRKARASSSTACFSSLTERAEEAT